MNPSRTDDTFTNRRIHNLGIITKFKKFRVTAFFMRRMLYNGKKNNYSLLNEFAIQSNSRIYSGNFLKLINIFLFPKDAMLRMHASIKRHNLLTQRIFYIIYVIFKIRIQLNRQIIRQFNMKKFSIKIILFCRNRFIFLF